MQSLRLLFVGLVVVLFVAFSASASSSAADVEEPGGIAVDIMHLKPLHLSRQLKQFDTAIVFYYVDYCPVCTRLRPVFAKASYLLQMQQQRLALDGAPDIKQKQFAVVNCGNNADGCISTGVSRVPAFRRFRNGGQDWELLRFRYVTAQSLVDAINA